VEILEVVWEVLELVGVIISATFFAALAIVLNALFVFYVFEEEEIEEFVDFSGYDFALSGIVCVFVEVEILLSSKLEVVVESREELDGFAFSETVVTVFVGLSLLTCLVLVAVELFELSPLY